jgi:hypothetical protein
MEHTGPFQMVTGFYTDAVNGTILARLEGDSTAVSRRSRYAHLTFNRAHSMHEANR